MLKRRIRASQGCRLRILCLTPTHLTNRLHWDTWHKNVRITGGPVNSDKDVEGGSAGPSFRSTPRTAP